MITENGRFSSSAIEDTQAALEAAGDEPPGVAPPAEAESTAGTATVKRATAGRKQMNGKPATTEKRSADRGGEPDPLGVAPVQVVVNVDASKLTGDQIAELIRALRVPAPTTTS